MSLQSNGEVKNGKCIENISAFRRFLSQFVAVFVKNILILDLIIGSVLASIIIPALTGIRNEHNKNETLKLTPVQASWLGSLVCLCEPIGSVISAVITDSLGRKKSMMLVNIPLIVGWIMTYNANSICEVFIANILFGIALGIAESPIITYVGEICEPRYRGCLIAMTNVTTTIGFLLTFVLNMLMPWRTVGLACLSFPIVTLIALCFIPETPLWLLSKNRTEEAEKALCWLRGWATKEAIADEFKELQRYSQRSKSCNTCIKNDEKCPHPMPTMYEKLKDVKRKQTLKPLFVVLALFFFSQFTGVAGMWPYVVQIFKAYGSPIDPDKAAAALSVSNNFANILYLATIRYPGKRVVYLFMMAGIVLCTAIISCYGFMYLPKGHNSFDQSKTVHLETKELAYIPFVCLIVWHFCTFCAIYGVPYQLLSEVFPFKVRGLVVAFVAAFDYLADFIASKTYYDLETSLSLPGISLLSCIVSVFGLILMYKILPETEDRTLEEIELHFSDKTKKLTDHNIAKFDASASNDSKDGDKTSDTERNESPVRSKCKGCDNRGFMNDAREVA